MAYNVTMKPEPLGKLANTPGTPIRITANLANSTDGAKAAGNTNSGDDLWCNKIEIKALSGNTGKIYIGKSTMNTTTMAGVVRVLEKGEVWQLVERRGGNVYRAGDYYYDSDQGADSAEGAVDVH